MCDIIKVCVLRWVFLIGGVYYVVEKRPEEDFFCRLDSSLKKNTAFVKKLVNLTCFGYLWTLPFVKI